MVSWPYYLKRMKVKHRLRIGIHRATQYIGLSFNCIMNYNPTVKYKNDKNCTLSLEWEFRKIIFYKMPLITAHKKKKS